jgi:hypothetical protein
MLFAPDNVELSGCEWGDANTAAGFDRLIKALAAAGRPVPAYLTAVRDEYAGRKLETASFAVGCYWEGERELGKLDGVVASRTGTLGTDEVVQVRFDPRKIDAGKLTETVKAMSCYRGVRAADASLALDPEQQHDLWAHPEYAYLPLTAMQATKVNSAVGVGADPSALLSPAQRRLETRLATAIGKAGGVPDWLANLQPDRSPGGLAVYLRSLQGALAANGG